VMQCDAVCCSVFKCVIVIGILLRLACREYFHVVVFCCALQCAAVCCSVLQCVIAISVLLHLACRRYFYVAVCCSALQCVAVNWRPVAPSFMQAILCCSVMQCDSVFCIVLQCIAIDVLLRLACRGYFYVALCCTVLQSTVAWLRLGLLHVLRFCNVL